MLASKESMPSSLASSSAALSTGSSASSSESLSSGNEEVVRLCQKFGPQQDSSLQDYIQSSLMTEDNS